MTKADAGDSIRPLRATDVHTWDLQADVVIAGFGVAGATASIEAARAGADVLVLERAGGWGGAAALAGGFIYLGGGTALQKACGLDDTAENMRAFLVAALGPGADEEKIADYCDGSVDHYNWLVEAGVPFKPTFWGEPGYEPPFDDGLMYSGGENAAPFNEIATPAPRGHVPQMSNKRSGEQGGGYMLMKPLAETAAALGVRSEYDIRAQRLVNDDDGRVVGLVATRYGTQVAVRAHRGVVLATGSFAYNDDMMARFAPRLLGRPAASVEEHDGRAIRMAQALGADLAHMDATEVAFFCDPHLFYRGILVNERGQRFVPEDTYSGRVGQLGLLHNDGQVLLIIDEQAYEEGMAGTTATPDLKHQPTWVCETGAELEAEIGLPEGALTTTVDLYNRHAAEGKDPLLHKKSEWVRPIGSPVAGIDLRGLMGGFTLGGLRTDLQSRVLHVDGSAIDGLFAAGRCTSGLSAWGYASGISLGDGSFYGRRAGASAARS